MVQLNRLEGFYWVAKTEGYARAARAFPYPITQPGVHQQVRRLEEEIGVRLFERAGKDRVTLTAAGAALYAYVAPFYEGLPAAVAALKSGTQGGKLRLHAAGHLLRHLLPPWLRKLQSKRPDIEIELTEVKHADPAALRERQADLLVDYLPAVPSDLEAVEVARVRAWVVFPSSHPLAGKKRVELSDLAAEPFIAYNADRTLRELQLRALEQHGVTPARTHSADSSDTILGFVAAGLGFSLVPSLQDSGPKVPGVVAHRLERPPAEFPIYAAWRRGGAPNPLVAAAIELAPRA